MTTQNDTNNDWGEGSLGNLEALAECLRREAALYRQMLDAMLRQRECLVQNDIASVEASVVSQEKILRQLSNAHKRSGALLARLGAEHELRETIVISDLLKIVPEPARTELAQASDELWTAVERVHRENNTNAALLVSAVEYVSFCMRVFGNQEPSLSYSPNGLKGSNVSNLAVDIKA